MNATPYVEHVHVGSAGLHVDAYRRMLALWASENGVAHREEKGPFGKGSAALVREFQIAGLQEHPAVKPSGSIGPATHHEITRWADDGARELLRREYERRHPRPTARQIVVEAALLAFTKRGTLVYSGVGRESVGRRWQGIDEGVEPPAVPTFADCSSLSTWCLWLARERGATDPSAREWARGSTATMEVNGRPVNVASAQPGALFFYVNPRGSRHVALMVERVRGIPFVVSFGAEGGPSYVRYDYRRARAGVDELTSVRDYIDPM